MATVSSKVQIQSGKTSFFASEEENVKTIRICTKKSKTFHFAESLSTT